MWGPLGAFRVPWGFLGGPGVAWGCLGIHLGVLLVAVDPGLLERPWAPRGRFPGFSGKFREPFWLHFGIDFLWFFVLFVASLFASILYGF